MRYYAGIGSRKTPPEILKEMKEYAQELEQLGFILRSGGAEGADTAFEQGVKEEENKEILRPKDATPEAIELASKYHPAWDKCNDYVRKLHGRNAQIILGKNLDTPVSFVLCWTPRGALSGGTALGIKIAQDHNINVFNFEKIFDRKIWKPIIPALKNSVLEQRRTNERQEQQ